MKLTVLVVLFGPLLAALDPDIVITTEDNRIFKNFYRVSKTELQFKVRANNDAHVALALGPEESKNMYKIIIGGNKNTESWMEDESVEPFEMSRVSTPQILKASEFRGFWIRWDDGVISVGREGTTKPFMSQFDPTPSPVCFFGVRTGWGSTGSWQIKGPFVDPSSPYIDVCTEEDSNHRHYPVSSRQVQIQVRARADGFVSLSPNPHRMNECYSIYLGQNDDNVCRIKKFPVSLYEKDDIAINYPQMLNASEFREFWVRWDNDTISIGREGETKPFMSFADPEPIPICFIGVRTGEGVAGSWKIKTKGSLVDPSSINKDICTKDEKYQFYQVTTNPVQFKINFKVRAANDAHIALTKGPEESDPMYEIIIGGWQNTKSAIIKNRKKPDKVEIETQNILNAVKSRGFWVKWDVGIISAGREGETKPFISWSDPEPSPVCFVGIRIQALGSLEVQGVMNSSSPEKGFCKMDNQYQFYQVSSSPLQFKVNFKVRSSNDVHIALTKSPQESDPMYEIIIGGWSNMKSVIRKNRTKQDQVVSETRQILNASEFRGIWVQWDAGIISAGREGDAKPFISWSDPEPSPVCFIGVRIQKIGLWEIEGPLVDPYSPGKGVCKENDQYEFYQVSSSPLQFKVKFKVRSSNDVHVALTKSPQESDPMYEIIIGGWSNMKSVIRKNRTKQDQVVSETRQILNASEFRGFWVQWDAGIISAGREGDAKPFISWSDPEPSPVCFIGVRIQKIGLWEIEGPLVDPYSPGKGVCTENNDQYQFYQVSSSPKQFKVKFKVRAPNDVHVALTKGPQESDPMYEIIIGGWKNTKSVIRKNRTKPDQVVSETRQILNASESREFWVQWDAGIISAGREGETKPFISWSDPAPSPVCFIGVRIRAIGVWNIEGPLLDASSPDKGVCKEDNEQYQFYQLSNKPVQFKVRAASDAHIALTIGPKELDPMYEIIIGGWHNTKSMIRKNRTKPDKVEIETPHILSSVKFSGFWVRWDSGIISAGREGETKPFISWSDPEPTPICFIGVRIRAIGLWEIEVPVLDASSPEKDVCTADKGPYQFYQVSSRPLQFKVRAANDAYIALTMSPKKSNPMYEIVIGGWKNTKSVIIRNQSFEYMVIGDTPQILKNGEYRGFWVRWDAGIISAGREGETIPFISWSDPKPKPVCYIGVATSFGASGSWKIKAQLVPSNPKACTAPTGESRKWVDEIEGQVPPGAVFGGQDKNGEPEYIARAKHAGDLVPGKLVSSHGCTFISWDGEEYPKIEYQVLVGGPSNWVPTSGAKIPPNAFVGGKTESGEPLFIGRVRYKGSVTLGKVHQSHAACYVPFDGKEIAFEEYDILTT